MHSTAPFSLNTQKYLNRFDEILAEMVRGMTQVKPTDSISETFILQMIPHHRAAIAMSENLLQYTTLIPLQTIAQGIIREQTQSISDMQVALPVCAACRSAPSERSQYNQRFRAIVRTMVDGMRNARRTNDIDADFMREMIPHHEGALRMCENVRRFRICPELQPITQAILVSQRAGIRQMEALLRQIRG